MGSVEGGRGGRGENSCALSSPTECRSSRGLLLHEDILYSTTSRDGTYRHLLGLADKNTSSCSLSHEEVFNGEKVCARGFIHIRHT